jgi:hypothetical protein
MWQRSLLTKPGLTPFDVRIARKVSSNGISPRDTQNEGQTLAAGEEKRASSRHVRAASIARNEKKEGGGEPTCAELL